jgi:Ca2+-binding EF-hand superfamily protein
LRIPFSQQKIDKIIKDFDQDGDNVLNFGKFLAVFDKELQLGGMKPAVLRKTSGSTPR